MILPACLASYQLSLTIFLPKRSTKPLPTVKMVYLSMYLSSNCRLNLTSNVFDSLTYSQYPVQQIRRFCILHSARIQITPVITVTVISIHRSVPLLSLYRELSVVTLL